MLNDTHVVNVGIGYTSFRHGNRVIPKYEVIYSVITFCHSEERLPVKSFYPRDNKEFVIQFYGTGIQYCVDCFVLASLPLELQFGRAA